jgi:2-amino-4-hydroxy-6-hydroxymethyldihydropteridine diphosphokinase
LTQVYISIGSNIDREQHVRSSVQELKQSFSPLLLSSVYESVAVGFEGDAFYNLVAGFAAEDLDQVTQILHQIEAAHGRERGDKKFSSRTLDLDLLLFGETNLQDQGIDVPRDEITRYAFVLAPLAEIAPQQQHPILHLSYQALWQAFQVQHAAEAGAICKIPFHWD